MLRVTVKTTRKSRISAITKKIAAATLKSLYQQSAYVRKIARNSIKKGRKKTKKGRSQQAAQGTEVSRPGSPPMWHGSPGTSIKRTIGFAVNPTNRTSVVGYATGGNNSIPIALERGGSAKWRTKTASGTQD